MNVLVVDTSSWISYLSGMENSDLDLALKESRVYLAPIVIAELLSGARSKKDRIGLFEFLNELPLCDTSFEHWSRVGDLRSGLLRRGIQVSTPDAHIAQCCLDLDGYLVSEDKIFHQIERVLPLRLL